MRETTWGTGPLTRRVAALLLGLGLALGTGAGATCAACQPRADELARLEAERDRTAAQLDSLGRAIQQMEALLRRARSSLAAAGSGADPGDPDREQESIDYLIRLIRQYEWQRATFQSQQAEAREHLAALHDEVARAAGELESCEAARCSSPDELTGCIDPLELPDFPRTASDLPDTECSVCVPALEAYRERLQAYRELRLRFTRLRGEARRLHASIESSCREVRSLESSGLEVPEDLRESLSQRIAELTEKLAELGEATRSLDSTLDDLDAQGAEIAACEQQYCGEVFQEPGSGGLVPSPSPVRIVELGDFGPSERHEPRSTECPECQEVADRLNRLVEDFNDLTEGRNQLIEQLDAIKAELAELRQRLSSEITNREITRLQGWGQLLVREIARMGWALSEWRVWLGFGDWELSRCEEACDRDGEEVGLGGPEPEPGPGSGLLVDARPLDGADPFDPVVIGSEGESPTPTVGPQPPSDGPGVPGPDPHGVPGPAPPPGVPPVGDPPPRGPVCGDGRVEGGEACDGNDLAGQTCQSVNLGFTGGELDCVAGCVLSFERCTTSPPPTPEAPPRLVLVPGSQKLFHVRAQTICPQPGERVAAENQGGGEVGFEVRGAFPTWLDVNRREGSAPGGFRPSFTCQVPPGDHDLSFEIEIWPIDPATGAAAGNPVTHRVEVSVRSP